MTKEQKSLKVVKEMFTAFGEGKIQEGLNVYSQDVDFQSPVTRAYPPEITWAKPRHSREEVAEYFKELDRRIKAQMPDLYDDVAPTADDGNTDDGGETKRKRSPVAPVDGDQGRQRVQRGSKVKLDAEDFANMRAFGLDTNDPEVLKEYARNKKESDQRTSR